MGLKDLLTRVISGLTGAVERPRVAPPKDEPIPTRAMAELYIEQGHLERAAAILRALDGSDAGTRLSEVEAMQARERLMRALAEGRGEPGVTLARDGAHCAIAWVLDEAGVARARALVADGELTLRVVRVSASVSGQVERAQTDHTIRELRGAEVVEATPGARLIVSVGLRAGERFASIAHAALGSD